MFDNKDSLNPTECFTIRHEIDNLREKSSIQMAFSKRQKTDLSTTEFEINSLKKSVNQNKSELKHLGTVAMHDLKSLKQETDLHLTLIKKEQSENEQFREQFLKLKEFFEQFHADQKSDVANLRKDFVTLREYNRVQVSSIKNVLETMMVEISKIKNEQTEFFNKTDNTLKILSGQTLRPEWRTEIFGMFGSYLRCFLESLIERKWLICDF